MKLTLDQLEVQVAEDMLIRGEELFASGAMNTLHSIDKNLWIGRTSDLEVEIQVAGNKVQSFTCECSEFRERKICPHIVAGLFRLRSLRVVVPSAPTPKKVISTTPKKLTVSTILETISENDLLQFVAEYARRDQQFATALKARFASSVQHLDLSEKYENLLLTVVKSNQSVNLSFSKTGSKKIYDTVQMLLEQAERELAEQHFAEVFEILKHVVTKITPILPRLSAHKNDLLAALVMAHGLLLRLISQSIPPDLREDLTTFAIQLLEKRFFFFYKIETLFLQWLLRLVQDPQHYDRLKMAISQELERRFHNRELEGKFHFFLTALIEKGGTFSEQNTHLEALLTQSWLTIHLIEIAYEWGYFSMVKWMGQAALRKSAIYPGHERITELLLQTAQKESDQNEIAKYASIRLVSTLEVAYYDLFAKAVKNNSAELERLLQALKTLPFSEKQVQLLCAIYADKGQWEEVLQLIDQQKSLELLLRYAKGLSQNVAKKFEAISWSLLRHYLDQHIGPPAAVRVRNYLRQLFLNEVKDTPRRLLTKIRKEYGDRPSLAEELEIFGR